MKRKILVAGGGILLIGLMVSWLVGGALVSPYRSEVGEPPPDLPIEIFRLKSESGSDLAGWHLTSPKADGVVVLFHGIRSDRRALLRRARWLHELGYSSVMVDFSAHGESTGDLVTLGHRERFDVHAAIDFARDQHPGEKIGVTRSRSVGRPRSSPRLSRSMSS